MANIKRTIVLTLNQKEADALENILGNLTGHDKDKAGLSTDQGGILSEIYDLLNLDEQ